jgi:hypothetical protein
MFKRDGLATVRRWAKAAMLHRFREAGMIYLRSSVNPNDILCVSAVQFRKIPPLCVDVSGRNFGALISAKFRRLAANSRAEAQRR